MRNLLNFLVKNGHCLLFLLLEVFCGIMLFRWNNYQSSVGYTAAGRITGRLYAWTAEVSSYFKLGEQNHRLTQTNILLEQENQLLRDAINRQAHSAQWSIHYDSLLNRYTLYQAQVINNSVNRQDNFITLNKGSRDGIMPEMGVTDGNGVIGIVYMTSEHYALVISLLNRKSNISCKFKNSEYFGYLKWDGIDPNYTWLHDVPLHARFSVGDTLVTSGYSAIFPEGLTIGTVEEINDSRDGLSYLLKVKLQADFSALDYVTVISNQLREEQQLLESQKAK